MSRLATILLVEDSDHDIEIIKINFKKHKIKNPLIVIKDGESAINYINGEGQYSDRELPDLILLDINLPRYNGKEVLARVKANDLSKKIPVVMLTTSAMEKDIQESYDLGAAGYIRKPVDFEGIQKVVSTINDYWLGIVVLPITEKN